QAAVRCYEELDVATGDAYDVFEIWDDTICRAYRKEKSLSINEGLNPYDMFSIFMEKNQSEAANEFVHDLGEVPFIPFKNNGNCYSDLDRIKRLIDAYDKTYSGFINDLEDIQEIIFVLTNYSGQNLNEFIRDLKYYKTIQVDSIGSEDKSGVSTLTIDIPVEAREKALEITRKSIFTMGQGIDPEMQGLDGTSGEAMKFLYALLELKAGLMETEFRLSFNQFIRAICRFKGIKLQNIIQTWTRTMIRNDAELVDMCSKSKGIISDKTIIKAHPFVEDVEAEEEQLAKEKEAELASYEFNNTGGEEDGNA
ncbi:phage portal protein, partial [Veillonella sp.]|uniref:phage portal protein n=1 Tax=Veillonella sp. TaxID=1926307 RepID=UPI0039933A6E